ncbi:class I SAM-dependent methyltransferase (plasmid) [Haloferax mediterranei ATCC 33500]|uniref:Class I SAM-dependent methyltransferase n=1 Tax=Haloferax mediterranei (strain ATCC 33500 / DSM 1411 / JCM 8866 / NBRC 14739 / NCIMB 2177 / R-4) TaxID=523841 RepID=I3RBA3_HALMT|nr:class I SAM-dependent methyltransferase [Haloferax mediterranei]AFK21513.1 methylase involved in ubiquinone/menaquinone biosynthesis [Haloferax mediterranei ATCC 33500]AHZ24432.1 tellurium resistance protein [Haloferax mediterranei ATCC 33500]ELZ97173.1 methylase involved in ubiquinone/menaquinone biosynthesis [Haloferax mediterranei ATCC 33500]MDX5990083.1 class I SAM-dependent methyltransferase [Haloferax mediterranei ATCC 33500]QCQ76832.1 class I SAM-dependent methyltransferase [Halofera
MVTWDERYRTGTYPTDPEPSPVLRAYLDTIPEGRALDVAAGSGRNALFLAEQGYEVDALDQSEEGLGIIRERAESDGFDDRIETVRADATAYDFPDATYDLITISYFRTLDRLGDIKAALKPGGILFYQHHLRSSPPATIGPSTDRYRLRSNELLHACLDLTVLYYEESTEKRDDRTSATATIVARNTHGGAQTYPRRHWDE